MTSKKSTVEAKEEAQDNGSVRDDEGDEGNEVTEEAAEVSALAGVAAIGAVLEAAVRALGLG